MTLRTATRRAFLYPAATATGETWADYANTVFDSLLAIEFRNAPSLAGATLYGSTPTISDEPAGGIVLSASGLECGGETRLDTGITPGSSHCMILRYTAAPAEVTIIAGVQSGGRFWIIPHNSAANLYKIQYGYGAGSSVSSLTDKSAGTIGLFADDGYFDGSLDVETVAAWSAVTSTIRIGARNDGFFFGGNIETFCAGTLKAGAVAATVASELYTRMATAAL